MILFAHGMPGVTCRRRGLRDFAAELYFVVGDVVSLTHHVDAHLQSGEKIFAGGWNVGAWDSVGSYPARTSSRARACGIGEHALAVSS